MGENKIIIFDIPGFGKYLFGLYIRKGKSLEAFFPSTISASDGRISDDLKKKKSRFV